MSDKILYTAEVSVFGGREDGTAKSTDGNLDVILNSPKKLGGTGEGTNPEQLFAAGYSACFIGAMGVVADRQKFTLPADVSVDGKVHIRAVGESYGLSVELVVTLPGMTKEDADALVQAAHQVCPYSNATRGNIDVILHTVVF